MELVIIDAFFMVILILCSISDIRKKEICIWAAALGILAALVYQLALQGADVFRIVSGSLPGFCIMGLSVLCDGGIGFGDGIVIWIGGLLYSLWTVLCWMFFAFVLCALWGSVMILLKKGGRGMQLPFVPFLTVSAIFVICY